MYLHTKYGTATINNIGSLLWVHFFKTWLLRSRSQWLKTVSCIPWSQHISTNWILGVICRIVGDMLLTLYICFACCRWGVLSVNCFCLHTTVMLKVSYINRQPGRGYHYSDTNACGESAASKKGEKKSNNKQKKKTWNLPMYSHTHNPRVTVTVSVKWRSFGSKLYHCWNRVYLWKCQCSWNVGHRVTVRPRTITMQGLALTDSEKRTLMPITDRRTNWLTNWRNFELLCHILLEAGEITKWPDNDTITDQHTGVASILPICN